MKKTLISASILAAIGLVAASNAMAYEAGDILVRGRLANVNPMDDSGLLSVPAGGAGIAGSGVIVGSDTIPELDFTYMISPNWGAELILGYSKHNVNASGTVAGLGQVIEAKALPPTLTLQYHFAPNSNVRPYIGVGVNYTYFFDEKVTGPLYQAGAEIKMDGSFGLAAQIGLDIAINDDWFFNIDAKYIDMNTTAHFKGTTAGTAEIDVDVNPLVLGLGIGRRF